jgi:hypothetical protein
MITVLLSLSIGTLFSAPIDLSAGYGEFKWGISPDALFLAAQKAYGPENVAKEKCQVEGYQEERITVRTDGVTNTFSFFRGAFYQLNRVFSPHILDYYSVQDINVEKLATQAKGLYSGPDGIDVFSSAKITGQNGDRVTGVKVTLGITNVVLFKEKIAELRSKSPDITSFFVEPLKKP